MTNWQTKKLGDLAAPGRSIISGPFGSSIGKRFFVEDGVPVIRGNNLTKGLRKFKDVGFVYLTPEKADELNAYAEVDDILYTAAGTIGQVGIIPKNAKYEKYTISNKQIRVRLDTEKILPEYAYKVLSSSRMIRLVESQNTGSTIPLINLGIIKGLIIQLPSIHEQQRIVSVLEVWDEYIEKLEQKIALKEQLKKGLMQQLLTGKKRLPGFNGEWHIKKLEDMAECLDNVRIPLNSSERETRKGAVPYCGANGIVGYVNDHLFDEDIILIAEDGGLFDEYKDRPIAYRMTGKSWVNNHAHVIKAKSSVSQNYLFLATVHKNILKYLNGGTRAKLNKSELLKIKYFLPIEKNEQNAIADVINNVYKEIEILNKLKNDFNEQKKYLLKNLITGAIRTPEDLKPLMQTEVQS